MMDGTRTELLQHGRNGVTASVQPLSDSKVSKKDDIDTWKELLKADREAAFEQLVKLYRQEIFDLCVRISGSRTEAEDLAQETFIRAYENLASFRLEAHPRTWLYRIAMNRSITFTRKMKRWRMQRGGDDELFPELPELSTPSSDQELEWKDLAEHAHHALQKLPQRQKNAVVLVVIKGMKYKEAAEVMGISVGGAKANVHQGIKKLREMLGE
ncbi:RNA polymerase sigma factor [bacterium]|nr:RNA polymerase sigma factor [bacterium]